MADIATKEIRTRREFELGLAKLGEELRQMIELECEAFPTDAAASQARRERAVIDYKFFCQTYFPHYVPTPHFSIFQEFVFKRLPGLIDGDTDAREVHEAPRGEAKSTYETQLGTLWCVCRAPYLARLAPHLPKKARKWLIVIIMNTIDQAAEMLEAIKAELDTNPRLAADFPEASGQGRIWQAYTAITHGGMKLRTAGTGKKLRGMRHGPYRPDLVFLDDLENDENIDELKQRVKVQNFVLRAVLGLAPPMGGMDVFYVGTSLHYDAAINRVGKAPGWRRRVFRAIVTLPDKMDMWDRWEGIYTSAATGTDEEKEAAEAEALAYYRRHKSTMDAGAVLSWPEVRGLYRLMCIRATDHAAFDQEYQNQAGNDDSAPFKNIQFWIDRRSDWLFFGAIDPSMGKQAKARDPSAILVGGLNRNTMILDVVEADIARRVPDLIISRAIDLQAEYGCLLWSVETVAFQEFLYTELIKRAGLRGIAFPAQAGPTGRDKDLSILSLQPHVANGLIRLHRSQHTLIEQLQYWPEADHDDGPDALEMLWRIATAFSVEWQYTSAGRGRARSTSRGRRNDFEDGWGDDD